MTPELLTAFDVMRLFRCTKSTLHRWRTHRTNPLRTVKLGGKVFFRPQDIQTFIDSNVTPRRVSKI